MFSKKTLVETVANSKQVLTFSGRVLNGLSAIGMRADLTQLQIDCPIITNNRCKLFNRDPVLVCLIGKRSQPTMSVGACIEMLWNPQLDMTIIQREIVDDDKKPVLIGHLVDVVIFDDSVISLALDSIETMKDMVEHSPALVVCVGKGVNITSQHDGIIFCCNDREALKTVLDWRLKKLRAEAEETFI